MQENFIITEFREGVLRQYYNGKSFLLQKGERYYNNGSIRMHRYVWEQNTGRKVPNGYHIHHKDEDPSNNRFENLELKEGRKHISEHMQNRVKENPLFFKEMQAKGIIKAKEWHASSEGIKWHSVHGAGTWLNREYKTLTCQVCNSEFKTRHSGESKYCHANCKAKAFRARQKLTNKLNMKALFESRFPFVEKPDDELSEEQLKVKQLYVDTYKEEAKTDRLQSIHANDGGVRGKTKRGGVDTGNTSDVLPE